MLFLEKFSDRSAHEITAINIYSALNKFVNLPCIVSRCATRQIYWVFYVHVCICVRNVYIRFVVLAAHSSRIFDRCMCCLEIGQTGLKIDTHNEKFF